MRAHEKLEAWKLSMQLVREIYELTKHFAKEEPFCLTQQMRRVAISIPLILHKVLIEVAQKNMHISSVLLEDHYQK